MTDNGKPEESQAIPLFQMSAQELAELVSSAHCLLWRAEVIDEGGDVPVWTIELPSVQVAQSFLPLAVGHDQTYIDAWAEYRFPEDRARADKLSTEALRRGDSEYAQEFRYWCSDGKVRWLYEQVKVRKVSECRWLCMGICTDITDRKMADEEMHRLVESARCLVWHALVEDQGYRIHWQMEIPNSEAAQELLPLEVMEGESWAAAWYRGRSPEEREQTDRVAAEAIRSGKTGYSNEFHQINAKGESQWLLEEVKIHRMGPNRWHCVGVCVDITDRKRAEIERTQLIKQLQQALTEVKRLSGMLPICACCKKIRDDEGYWQQIDAYVKEHADVRFTHGICPECEKNLYPEYQG